MAERDEPTGALVRPYAVTRGRTRPRLEIAIEALIETTVRGRTAGSRPGGNHGQEQQYIATMCGGRRLGLGVRADLVGRQRGGGHGTAGEGAQWTSEALTWRTGPPPGGSRQR